MIKLDPNVAWERVAEPQADLSDVEILQKVAHDLYGYTPRQPAADAMTMMGGRVEVKLEPPMNYENIVRFTREELDQSPIIENLDHILSLTSCYETIAEFLDAFHPTRWARAESNSLGYGCACGPMKNPASGAIEVQSTCAHFTSGGDGMVHEVWHQRIHALGIDFETHQGLFFENTDDEVYDSPIRKDKPRPMPAVIQAQYSYIGVTDFYRTVIDQLFKDDENLSSYRGQVVSLEGYLNTNARNVLRIREGVDTIRTHLRPTPDIGERYFQGYMNYAQRVIDQSIEQLKFYENKNNTQYDWGPRI
jgi:hypothetical protein